MFFFFFFNDEKRIGFKKLSSADLGLSSTSHQSHIGLYEGLLTFLSDRDVVRSAMLIYNDYCDILNCTFDRIQNPDGSYRSPKIRIGEDSTKSIVTKIRDFALQYPHDDWYLAWFGLDSKELVFWLIKSNTKDYEFARQFFPNDNITLDESSSTYALARDFLLNKINFNSLDIQKDIEISSQLGDINHLYKRMDIDKAAKQYKDIGLKGEQLVAAYLDRLKNEGNINSYIWENQSSESGLPFDFIINDKIFVDVKSTRFDFNQYLFYSNQEIGFAASQNPENYFVYRVYDMQAESNKLQICNNCMDYMQTINNPINALRANIESRKALLQTVKIGIRPNDCFTKIDTPIIL